MDDELIISSWNVNGVKSSSGVIREICEASDIVFLQELLILPHDCGLLSSIHSDFSGLGISAVEVEDGPITGRPYGGVGVLWRKSLNQRIEICDTTLFKHFLALKIIQPSGRTSCFIGTYLPTDYNDTDSLVRFSDALEGLGAFLDDLTCDDICIVGDFNANFLGNKRFFIELRTFCSSRGLRILDTELLPPDSFTYISPSMSHFSWLDHAILSEGLSRTVSKLEIRFDFSHDDHMPIFTHLVMEDGFWDIRASLNDHLDSQTPHSGYASCDWHSATKGQIDNYRAFADELFELTNSKPALCSSSLLQEINDNLSWAAERFIPIKTSQVPHSQIPGWNACVKEAHSEARSAFLDWKDAGKPRDNPIHFRMLQSRARFKSALRKCRRNRGSILADKLANHLMNKNFPLFWKEVQQCESSQSLPDTLDGIQGESNIADKWRSHFCELLNPATVSSDVACDNSLLSSVEDSPSHVTRTELLRALRALKQNASPGQDGLSVNHISHGGNGLLSALSNLFSMILREGLMPPSLREAFIVPIPKKKFGDLSSSGNYRGIAISGVITKLFEQILLYRMSPYLVTGPAQFGFKPNLDTAFATFVLESTVDRYTKEGSSVFACFLDASQAFDRVRHPILFRKLRERGTPNYLVRVLSEWYSHQKIRIKWGNSFSNEFEASTGVRQGGCLSPLLFNVFIEDLIQTVMSSGIGCHLFTVPYNIFAYADDIVLLAPTRGALQKLINIAHCSALQLDVIFNPSKSACMVFNGTPRSPLKIGNVELAYVNEFCYLGHIIESSGGQSQDLRRIRRSFFKNFNTILFRFAKCSPTVKVALFRSYCMHLFGTELWCRLHQYELKELFVAFHASLKRLCGLPRRSRNSPLCASLGLLTLDRTLALRQILFFKRLTHSQNLLIRTTLNFEFSGSKFPANMPARNRKKTSAIARAGAVLAAAAGALIKMSVDPQSDPASHQCWHLRRTFADTGSAPAKGQLRTGAGLSISLTALTALTTI